MTSCDEKVLSSNDQHEAAERAVEVQGRNSIAKNPHMVEGTTAKGENRQRAMI